MGNISKQVAIYTALIMVCLTFTLIAPFYPKVAEDKGVPLWLIGVVFSLNPAMALVTTLLLGKYMVVIGRKLVVLMSFIFTALSMLILSPIEFLDTTPVIILSLASRSISGIGMGCLFTSITTIFISDYPDKIQLMISRMESAVGVGLILGPLIGTALYTINLFAALIFVGGMILIFSPFAWMMLGQLRPYDIKSGGQSRLKLFLKPVILTQKIIFPLLMCVAFLFSFGVVVALGQIHLESYGLSDIFIALCFVLESATYLSCSLGFGHTIKNVDERIIMIIGITFIAVGYLLFGPWDAIFPQKIYFVIIAIFLIGIGQSLTYCIKYLVFSVPYMIKSAVNDYGYENDDILNDTISSFAVIATSVGEILGPLYAGIVSDLLSIKSCLLIISIASFAFLFAFAYATGFISDLLNRKKKTSIISSELIKADDMD